MTALPPEQPDHKAADQPSTPSGDPGEIWATTDHPGTDPQPGLAGQPAAPGAAPSAGRGRRVAVIAVVAGVVGTVALASGIAYGLHAADGPGDQAVQHVPDTAGAVVTVDLDPSLGQKVDLLRFAAKFPSAGFTGSGDGRQDLWQVVTRALPDAPSWKQAEPWLGRRAALAVLPGSGVHPVEPVAVLAVTDDAAARRALGSGRSYGAAVRDGWAYLARTGTIADRALDRARTAPLTGNAEYTADVARIGAPGILNLWIDNGRVGPGLTKALAESSGAPIAGSLDTAAAQAAQGGHGAVAVHFRPDAVELTGSAVGAATRLAAGDPGVAALPADTTVALGITGAGEQLTSRWPVITEGMGPQAGNLLDLVEERTGLALPGDLASLLGRSTTLAVRPHAGSADPEVGVVVQGGQGWRGPMAKLHRLGLPFQERATATGYILASTPAYTAHLATPGSATLGSSPAFTRAVPDAAGAAVVGFVNARELARVLPAEDAEAVSQYEALGVSVRAVGSDRVDTRIRLTTR